jgi:hypothetical protein
MIRRMKNPNDEKMRLFPWPCHLKRRHGLFRTGQEPVEVRESISLFPWSPLFKGGVK